MRRSNTTTVRPNVHEYTSWEKLETRFPRGRLTLEEGRKQG